MLPKWLSVLFLVFVASAAARDTKPKGENSGWEPPAQKKFSRAEKQAECRKYEGKLISFYQDLYKVENCRRRLVRDEAEVAKYLASEQKVFSVTNDTIIMLEPGQAIEAKSKSSLKCSDIEGGYVTTGGESLYFVERCKLRKFQDWESFSTHRARLKLTRRPIVELSQEQKKSFGLADAIGV